MVFLARLRIACPKGGTDDAKCQTVSVPEDVTRVWRCTGSLSVDSEVVRCWMATTMELDEGL